MKLESKLSPGDKAWVFQNLEIVALTVGEVHVTVVDSPGMVVSTFDNFKPQKSYKEEYMCVESGIGSGSLFTLGKNLFVSKQEAEEALMKHFEEGGIG